jgi:hypothetical protein
MPGRATQLITQSSDPQSAKSTDRVLPLRKRLQSLAVAFAFTTMLVALWLLAHRYKGLTNDAHLYALQALAKIHTDLAGDLYLQFGSQDRYTVFSPFYAAVIRWAGLQDAALLLTVAFTVWILAAGWSLARRCGDRDIAWLAAAAFILIPGDYGGFGVFNFPDQYLTARLPAEALVITSIACYFRGHAALAAALSVAALFVHPIMALPGLLVLLCMNLQYRTIAAGVAIGLAAVAILATTRLMTVIDPSWLEVVRERSEFLFVQLWHRQDWEINARPLVCLCLTAGITPDVRIRKLCIVSIVVAVAGLIVAWIAGGAEPVALLVQGQAWRWIWIAGFAAILFLPYTAIKLWNEYRCGPLCATLLLLGWLSPLVDGLACVAAALLLWAVRAHVSDASKKLLLWTAVALCVVMALWTLGNSWTMVTSAPAETGREPTILLHIRNILGLGVPAIFVVGILWWWLRSTTAIVAPLVLSGIFLAGCTFSFSASFTQLYPLGQNTEGGDFADWKRVIPTDSSVLVTPARDTGSFVWFTLVRPNYLTVDQSAGVIFSQQTALEVRRRSQILLPLMDPNWMVRSNNRKSLVRAKDSKSEHPLTKAILINICQDEHLGFVISPENVGYDPMPHKRADSWKDWNLYDCRQVRSAERGV